MRRTLVCLVAFLAFAAAGAGPGHAGIRTERRAEAFFLLPERDGRRPFLYVTVHEITADYEGFGLSRGFCYGDDIPASCKTATGSAIAGELRGGDVFEIDPALDAAYLKVTRKGVTHELTWTATGDPAPSTTEHECGPVPAGPKSAGVTRAALASGTIFGRELTTPAVNEGSASLVAEAFGC